MGHDRTDPEPLDVDERASAEGDVPTPAEGDEPAPVERPPIEPGTPSPENVLFVLLGALAALGVVLRLFQLFA